MNQVAIVFGLLIAAVVGVGAFQALSPLISTAENEAMEAEIINLVRAVQSYDWTHRLEATPEDGTVEILVDQGFLDAGTYDDGDRENVAGENIAILADPDGDSTITYTTDDEESCEWLEQRANSGAWPNVENADNCAGDTDLVVNLE